MSTRRKNGQFAPGESGNPLGRAATPHKKQIQACIEEFFTPLRFTELLEAAYRQAVDKKDAKCIELCLSYGYGKPKTIEVDGDAINREAVMQAFNIKRANNGAGPT